MLPSLWQIPFTLMIISSRLLPSSLISAARLTSLALGSRKLASERLQLCSPTGVRRQANDRLVRAITGNRLSTTSKKFVARERLTQAATTNKQAGQMTLGLPKKANSTTAVDLSSSHGTTTMACSQMFSPPLALMTASSIFLKTQTWFTRMGLLPWPQVSGST